VQFPVRQYKYFTDSGRIERKGPRLKSKPNANPFNLCAFYELCISISEWGNCYAKFTPENLATNTDSGKMLAKFIYKLSHLLHVCVCVGQPWTFACGSGENQPKVTQPPSPNEYPLILMCTHLRDVRVGAAPAPHLELMSCCYWCIISTSVAKGGSLPHPRYSMYMYVHLTPFDVAPCLSAPRCLQMSDT